MKITLAVAALAVVVLCVQQSSVDACGGGWGARRGGCGGHRGGCGGHRGGCGGHHRGGCGGHRGGWGGGCHGGGGHGWGARPCGGHRRPCGGRPCPLGGIVAGIGGAIGNLFRPCGGRPAPPPPPPPPRPSPLPASVTGFEGPIYWVTSWTRVNGVAVGRITFYYRAFVGTLFKIVQQRTYTIGTQSIPTLLAKFKVQINFVQIQNRPPPQNGASYNYNIVTINGVNKITMFYKLYVNGQAVVSIQKQYTLSGGYSISAIMAIYNQFVAYCKANSHYTTETTPEVRGNIDWSTKYVNGQQIMTANYKEYKGDQLIRTKSHDFPLTSGSDAEIKQKLDQFKQMLRNGQV